VEVVGIGRAVEGILHTDDGIAVTIILPPSVPTVKKKASPTIKAWEA
jgi:hypothetical protein